MPELPEVQATVDGIKARVLGRRFKNLWTDWPKMLKDPLDQRRIRHNHVRYFKSYLRGEKILSVKRRAKNIVFDLSGGKAMLIHQKMSGHLLLGKWKILKGRKERGTRDRAMAVAPSVMKTDPWNGYIRLIFYFNQGPMLAFSDLRRFGKVIVGRKSDLENLPELKNLGPEPLGKSFDFKKFESIITRERRKVKQVLMDPFVIAGIGNIYSDDILWRAKIHPFRSANHLKKKELNDLFKAMKTVLAKAMKFKGTSAGDYRTPAGQPGDYFDSRYVYKREGEPCRRCGRKIVRVKMGGRSARYCPRCQKY